MKELTFIRSSSIHHHHHHIRYENIIFLNTESLRILHIPHVLRYHYMYNGHGHVCVCMARDSFGLSLPSSKEFKPRVVEIGITTSTI
jgi:hypothetical protein